MTRKFVSASILLTAALIVCSCAPVTIRTVPEKAEIYSPDGARLGRTPFFVNIITSEKHYVVRRDGYLEQAVTIGPESARYVDVRMPRIAPTMLRSQPPGAAVYTADGNRFLGMTPYAADVSERDRVYKLRMDGFYDKDVQVSLESPSELVSQMDPRPIMITISSTPAGAMVYEAGDREPIGQAPVQTLVKDQTMYELKADKYYPSTVVLSTQSDVDTMVSLEPMPYITIESSPAGAELYLQGGYGKSLGTTPLTRLVETATAFELRKEGYDPKPFTLSSDAPSTVKVEMMKIPYVTIKSDPAGAQLYRMGGIELIGTTPVKEIVRQPTQFEMHLEGYEPKSFVVSGKKPDVTISMEGNETILMDRHLSATVEEPAPAAE